MAMGKMRKYVPKGKSKSKYYRIIPGGGNRYSSTKKFIGPKWYNPNYVNLRGITRSVLPSRIKTKLVYNNVFDVTQAMTTNYQLELCANGMNDPIVTGPISGHQPMGFDQLALFYNNYVVTGVKIVLEGNWYSAGTYYIGQSILNAGLTPYTSVESISEAKQCLSFIGSNQKPFKYTKNYDIGKELGVKKSTLRDESNYWGLMTGTTNPPFGNRIHLFIKNLDDSEQVIFQLSLTLVYYCEVFNSNALPFS